VLVACAGISSFTALEEHPDALWDDTLAINLTSVFRLARACAPLLRASGRGRIVTIGSVMSAFGDAGMAAYCREQARRSRPHAQPGDRAGARTA
jgi:NAD(P)-dependent dehydrogenase (short-subunit alcohol dehydrogenase family)